MTKGVRRDGAWKTKIKELLSANYRRTKRSFRYLPKMEYQVCIDAGAHRGEFTDGFLQLHSPHKMILLEPLPDIADTLKERFRNHPEVRVLPVALSNQTGSAEFQVNEYDVASSLLNIDKRNSSWFGLPLGVAKTVPVGTVTLPDLFEREKLEKVDLLKLDIQGAEGMVLEAGKEVLSRVKVLYTEVQFQPMYEHCKLIWWMNDFLEAQEFQLVSLQNVAHSKEGEILQANAIYRRKAV